MGSSRMQPGRAANSVTLPPSPSPQGHMHAALGCRPNRVYILPSGRDGWRAAHVASLPKSDPRVTRKSTSWKNSRTTSHETPMQRTSQGCRSTHAPKHACSAVVHRYFEDNIYYPLGTRDTVRGTYTLQRSDYRLQRRMRFTHAPVTVTACREGRSSATSLRGRA